MVNYLLAFTILDLINPFGLDSFNLPKVWLVSLIIAYYQSKQEYENKLLPLVFCLLAFALIYLSSDWSSTLLGSELMGFNGIIQLFIYYSVFNIAKYDSRDAIILFMIPMLAYGILQRVGYDYPHPTWAIPTARAVSTQGNPVFFSTLVGILFPIVVNKVQKRWVYFSLISLMLGALRAAGSKCGWLGAGVGMFFYWRPNVFKKS